MGIGGGVGAASLYPQIRKLHEMGVEGCNFRGRSEEFVILHKEFEAICNQVYYATDDGSKGKEAL